MALEMVSNQSSTGGMELATATPIQMKTHNVTAFPSAFSARS